MEPGTMNIRHLHADTVGEMRRRMRTLLNERGCGEDCDYILSRSLARTRAWLYAHPEYRPGANEKDAVERALAKRLNGAPLAHVQSQREFYSLEFEVSADVLIPRPETELLVDQALLCRKPAARMLDLGTGCGNIALTVGLRRPGWSITATDVSNAALAVAKRNALRHGAGNVEFKQSDWFKNLHGRFDLIVSNPPYVATGDPEISPGVALYEPALALFAKNNGLACLETIIAAAPGYMTHEARLIVEHGHRQAAAVRRMMQKARFAVVNTYRDGAGHLRATTGQMRSLKDRGG